MSIKIKDGKDRIIFSQIALKPIEEIEEMILKRLKQQADPENYSKAMAKAAWQYPKLQRAFRSAYQKYLEEV